MCDGLQSRCRRPLFAEKPNQFSAVFSQVQAELDRHCRVAVTEKLLRQERTPRILFSRAGRRATSSLQVTLRLISLLTTSVDRTLVVTSHIFKHPVVQ